MSLKNLYIIGGTMGVGKTTTCRILKNQLKNSAFLDGDWCWDMNPFSVTDETKKMVLDNICYVLNNFIKCSLFENIIFCWVLHEQSIIDTIMSKLNLTGVKTISVSLVCREEKLRERLYKDVRAEIRKSDIIDRSIQRAPLYEKLNTYKINVSDISAEEAAKQIKELTQIL